MSDKKNPKTVDKLDGVMGRAIRDPEFRKKLVEKTKETLVEEGLSEDELDAVSGGVTTHVHNIATVFSNTSLINQLTRAAWSTDRTCNERGGAVGGFGHGGNPGQR